MEKVGIFFSKQKTLACGIDPWPLAEKCGGGGRAEVMCVFQARVGGMEGEKPGFPHLILNINFVLCVLLALDFNEDEFLCVFFWVHNG